MPLTTSSFNLPDHLMPKADPVLAAGDEAHFAAIAESLEQKITDLSDRLDATRPAPACFSQESLERDVEIRRLTARRAPCAASVWTCASGIWAEIGKPNPCTSTRQPS